MCNEIIAFPFLKILREGKSEVMSRKQDLSPRKM